MENIRDREMRESKEMRQMVTKPNHINAKVCLIFFLLSFFAQIYIHRIPIDINRIPFIPKTCGFCGIVGTAVR